MAKTAKPTKTAKAAKAAKQPKKQRKQAVERDDHEDDHEDPDDDDETMEEDCSKLTLPSGRVTLMLRKALVGKRFGADNGVFATGVIEHVINTIAVALKKAAGSSSAAGKAKRVDYKTLVKAIRSHSDLSRVFASYVFSPGGNPKLRVHPTIFLTKADREVYATKRAEEKVAREKARSVPAVDEA